MPTFRAWLRPWVGLLVLVACGGTGPVSAPSETDPTMCPGCNLVLLSIDTLRADRLGVYGGPAVNAPRIDAWAARATVFEHAYSTANRTADAHMSIFTGLYPSVHQIRNADRLDRPAALLRGIETLAQVLQRQGYATAGFHGGGNVAGAYGFDRGFDRYESFSRFRFPQTEKLTRAQQWIQARGSTPFFAFVHTYFIHDPYLPSEPYRSLLVPEDAVPLPTVESLAIGKDEDYSAISKRFWAPVDPDNPAHVATLRALYDAAIREIDDHVGEFLAQIGTLERPTVVVLLSDHGEEFMEHGMLTHHQLYNELLHVPLIIRLPGTGRGQRVATPISLVDIAPTLLDILGTPALNGAQGTSVRALLTDVDPASVARSPRLSEKVWRIEPMGAIRSLRFDDGLKVITNLNRGDELYDLRDDPREQQDQAEISVAYPALKGRVRQLAAENAMLRERLLAGDNTPSRVLDDETRKQLRALGYGG